MARWMGKLKEAVAIHNMDDIHGLHAEQMKPDTKEYILYDSISMKFKNRQNQSMATELRIVTTLGINLTLAI